jgi:hypothetical protein
MGLLGLIGILSSQSPFMPLFYSLPFFPSLIPLFVAYLTCFIFGLFTVVSILFLIPIPTVISGATGRMGRNGNIDSEIRFSALPKIVKDVLEKDECVERMSCEMGRMSRKLKMDKWVEHR